MKALVYNGPRDVKVKEMPDARIEAPTDVLVRITSTNICGSDLHMYEGRTDLRVGRGEVKGCFHSGQEFLESRATLLLRFADEAVSVPRKEVESDEGGGRLLRELAHSGCGRMQPQLQRIEIESSLAMTISPSTTECLGRRSSNA